MRALFRLRRLGKGEERRAEERRRVRGGVVVPTRACVCARERERERETRRVKVKVLNVGYMGCSVQAQDNIFVIRGSLTCVLDGGGGERRAQVGDGG